MEVLLVVLGWISAGTLLLAVVYRSTLLRLWQEPVLRRPVLIVESDDWGAGPLEQAAQLERIAAVLAGHRDSSGRKAVMTLGTVLAVADGGRMLADGLRTYYAKRLDEPEFEAIVGAIKRGVEAGVFSLQLHCEEHYWPPALLAAARKVPEVRSWLSGHDTPKTEALPPALQSRWVDGTQLPTKPLPAEEASRAARSEAASFDRIFGFGATVAVPPTFIWNDTVETAWAERGVRFVVTPGRRFEERDGRGDPVAAGPTILNGEQGMGNIRYIVRDDYFEFARGHKAEHGLAALSRKTRAGRPTLLETHRDNFLVGAAVAEDAVRELDRLLTLALQRFPSLLFLSTEELGERMEQLDPELTHQTTAARLHICLRRVGEIARLRKLAYLTGTVIPAAVVYLLTRSRVPSGAKSFARD